MNIKIKKLKLKIEWLRLELDDTNLTFAKCLDKFYKDLPNQRIMPDDALVDKYNNKPVPIVFGYVYGSPAGTFNINTIDVVGLNMVDISVHRITSIAIDTPNVDHNWVQFTIKNSYSQECEVTMFLQQGGDDKVTLYEFLHEMRDSTERAIKELLSGDNS